MLPLQHYFLMRLPVVNSLNCGYMLLVRRLLDDRLTRAYVECFPSASLLSLNSRLRVTTAFNNHLHSLATVGYHYWLIHSRTFCLASGTIGHFNTACSWPGALPFLGMCSTTVQCWNKENDG